MAQEPDNLVLERLRGTRGDILDLREGLRGIQNDIRNVQDNHTLRFDFLEECVETLRWATMIERVEKLEKAK
jgi:hypothetical protein